MTTRNRIRLLRIESVPIEPTKEQSEWIERFLDFVTHDELEELAAIGEAVKKVGIHRYVHSPRDIERLKELEALVEERMTHDAA